MDTIFLVAAFCLLTEKSDSGWIAVSADSVVIQTALIQERSRATWHNSTNVSTSAGTLITFKPALMVEIYDRRRLIIAKTNR